MSESPGLRLFLSGVLFLCAALLSVACGDAAVEVPAPEKNVVDIDIKAFAAEVHADLAQDGRLDSFLLFDVRSPAEFELRSIPGAISLPFVGTVADRRDQVFTNPHTGQTGAAALTRSDGSVIPKGQRMIFYSGRSG